MPNASSSSDASDLCANAPRVIRPALYLDYGADCTCGEDAACEVCSRGMRFRSRWQFELGSLLQIAFTLHDKGVPSRLEVEAVVVECNTEDESGLRLTTLAFIEPPESLQSALGEVSARLVFPPRE